MPALFSGAAIFCYPSLSEGFGLPILDAFACGTPVLTGNSTSLPEVAGEAALLVEANDPQSIAHGLGELLTSPQKCSELVEKGRRRAQEFTWEKSAASVARALELAVGNCAQVAL